MVIVLVCEHKCTYCIIQYYMVKCTVAIIQKNKAIKVVDVMMDVTKELK